MYIVNGLSPRFESIANIIRYRSPLPTFSETRSMLLLAEQQLAHIRIPPTTHHADHSSSAHALTTGRTNQRRNDCLQTANPRQDRHHDRRQQPSHPSQPPSYGWIYIPPPSTKSSSRQQQQRSYQAATHPPSAARNSPSQAHIATTGPKQSSPQPTVAPPWGWFSGDQPTALPEMFSSMSLGE